MTLFFKYSNPEISGKELLLKVEVEPNNAYSIRGGKISFFEPISVKALSNHLKPKPDLKFTADEFSEMIRHHGFDENDVRMELEDLINSHKKDEIV